MGLCNCDAVVLAAEMNWRVEVSMAQFQDVVLRMV